MNDNINITDLRHLYFIGIGGIGMSAIARYFNAKGIKVSGYDKTQTELTKKLEAEGIAIHYDDKVELAPKNVDVIVYTPAIPADNNELLFYKNNNYQVLKRSDILKIITESSFNICVAGTHGKTTVSTMVAHILRHTGYGCNAFLGGISSNYGTNFWSSEKNVCVIEADEYDRSFLKLLPNVAVITAVDPDHLDIYGTAEEFEKAFVDFAGKVKLGGCLISKKGLKCEGELQSLSTNEQMNKLTYSLLNNSASVYAHNVVASNGSYKFDITGKDWLLEKVELNMGGLHNIENMTAAIAVSKYLEIEDEKIKFAVADFKGIKRRFEYIIKNDQQVLIDDYAHHPEELKALINGVRSLFDKRLTIVFQPHLYSRTKDQADGFAEVLGMADEVIILPIYPARELPMEGVSSNMIIERMSSNKGRVLEKLELVDWIKNEKPELLVMAGAGDIDVMVYEVKKILTTD